MRTPRSLIATVVALLSLALPMSAVRADTTSRPIHGTFDFGYETFLDTEVCAGAPWGFDVTATQHEYGFFDVVLDADGDFVRAIVHQNYDAWISANGTTIVERDTWTSFLTPDGARQAGLTVHIQGPGGIVVRDAGLVFDDASGNVVGVKGPHEQLFGVSFCPALTP
jgi:hypothetical protein